MCLNLSLKKPKPDQYIIYDKLSVLEIKTKKKEQDNEFF